MSEARLHHGTRRVLALMAGAVAALCVQAAPALGQTFPNKDPEDLKGVGLESKTGAMVPLSVPIVDSTGKTVPLSTYFNQGKPVVLALVYYNCPMICPLVLARLQERLNGLAYTVGDDFNVVVISFDPTNTTKMAADNKAVYLAGYDKPLTKSVEAGWTFHTAGASEARQIAEAVGFKYHYIEESGQYAHPAVLTVLTSDGRVSGYVSGLEPEPNDLRVALLEASQGKIAKGIGDFFLHTCYRYDPRTGKYSLQATRVMQMGGLVTVSAIAALIAALRAGERARAARKEKRSADEQHGPAGVPARAAMGHTP
jgi:protein SCO1